MDHSIRLKTEELSPTLIEGLKKYFTAIKAKEVVINFSSPAKAFLRNETKEETNKRIETAISEAESGKAKWVTFTGEEFEELSKALSKMDGA